MISVREILVEAKNVYLKNFRALSLYLIFVSAVSFFLSLVASLFIITTTNIFVFLFAILLILIAPFIYFKVMIGFQYQLRNALQKEKLVPIRETLRQPNSLIFKALGTSILSGILTTFPILFGMTGLAFQNRNTFFTWLETTLQSPEAASLPIIEIHGIWGYFFLLLSLYGIIHLLYFSVVFSMSYYTVLFDKKNITESLKKSMQLIQGRWWNVGIRLLIPSAIFFLLYGMFAIISSEIQKQFGSQIADTFDFFFSIFLNFFAIIPLAYLPGLILFEELMKKPLKK